jgi:hypothetical protein
LARGDEGRKKLSTGRNEPRIFGAIREKEYSFIDTQESGCADIQNKIPRDPPASRSWMHRVEIGLFVQYFYP